LAYIISCAYLKNGPENDQEAEVCGALKTELLSLGSHLNDYNVAKTLLDKYYNMLRCCGYGKYFFKHLIAILDWQSVLTVNILKYIVEKYSKIPSAKSKEEIYNMYIEQAADTIFPYSEMPSLSGDSLVVINIKTEEQLNFWRGYFTLEKKIREEEYAAIKELLSDENSAFNCASSIDSYILNSWIHKVNRGDITSEAVAKIQIETNCSTISNISESSYKSRMEGAEKRLNTIRLNPINELTSKFTGFFNKFKK